MSEERVAYDNNGSTAINLPAQLARAIGITPKTIVSIRLHGNALLVETTGRRKGGNGRTQNVE